MQTYWLAFTNNFYLLQLTEETPIRIRLDAINGVIECFERGEYIPFPVGPVPIDVPNLICSCKNQLGEGISGFLSRFPPMRPDFMKNIATSALQGGDEQFFWNMAVKIGLDAPAGDFIEGRFEGHRVLLLKYIRGL